MFRNVAMNLMIESIHEMRQEIYQIFRYDAKFKCCIQVLEC